MLNMFAIAVKEFANRRRRSPIVAQGAKDVQETRTRRIVVA